jgi:hypothetical protein
MRRDRSRYLANGKPSCRVNCRWPRGECPDHPLPVVVPPGVFADPRSFEHIEVGAEYPICPVCHYQRCSCPPPLGWHEKKWASGIRGFERDDNRGAVWPEIPSPKPTWGCGPSPELGKDNYSSTLAWGRTGHKASAESMAFVDEQLKAEDAKKVHVHVGPSSIGSGVTSSPSVGSGVTSGVTKFQVGQTPNLQLQIRAGWHVRISKNWDFGSGFERDDRRAVVYFPCLAANCNRYLDMWTVAPAVPNTECCYSSQEPGGRTDLPSAGEAMAYADAKLLETETAQIEPSLRSGWHPKSWANTNGFERDDKLAAVVPTPGKPNSWTTIRSAAGYYRSAAGHYTHYTLPSRRSSSAEVAMDYADEMLRLENAKKSLDVSKNPANAAGTSENLWADLAGKPQAEKTPDGSPIFKFGDLVRCVESSGFLQLKIGCVYSISESSYIEGGVQEVRVNGLPGKLLAKRFDLVPPDEAPPDWERVDAETYRHKSGWNVLRTSTGLWLLWSRGTARPVGKNRSTMHEAMATFGAATWAHDLSSLTDVCNLWNGASRQASKPISFTSRHVGNGSGTGSEIEESEA